MKKNTVKDLYEVIAKLNTTELVLLKKLMDVFEKLDPEIILEDDGNAQLLYSKEGLIRDINFISDTELHDYKIIENFESLCKKGILTKDDEISEINEALKDYFGITINWDAEIE